MKTIEVKDQVRLSLARCFELVLSGLKYRLFRAAITVVIISLAAAFLMTMLSESLISRQVKGAVEARLAPQRKFLFWFGWISVPLSERELTDELARSQSGGNRRREFKTWGRLSDEDLARLVRVAESQKAYLKDFFDTLNEGELRGLVDRARGAEILRHLSDEEEFRDFASGVESRGLLSKLEGGIEGFRSFLREWRETRPLRVKILDGHRKAVDGVAEEILKGRSAKEVLASADETLPGQLARFGFQMPADEFPVVHEYASLSLDADIVVGLLKVQAVKTRLAGRRNVTNVSDVNEQMLQKEVGSTRGAKWLLGVLADLSRRIRQLEKDLPRLRRDVPALEAKVESREQDIKTLSGRVNRLKRDKARPEEISKASALLASARTELKQLKEGKDGLEKTTHKLKSAETDARGLLPVRDMIESFSLPPERIRQVAANRLDQSELVEVEANVLQLAGGEGFMGFSGRTQWLILVSFMVCAVGIANAMLMSVTERFQEIATMKCLGATDGFIMTNFILESIMQGIAGGLIGTVLGVLLGMLRGAVSYGLWALGNIPPTEMLAAAGISVVVSVVISALAAVYPSWVAARLAPMEAMRIE